MGNTAVHSRFENHGKWRRNYLPKVRGRKKPVTYVPQCLWLQNELLTVTCLNTLLECEHLVYQVDEKDYSIGDECMVYIDIQAAILSSRASLATVSRVELHCSNKAFQGVTFGHLNTPNLEFPCEYALNDIRTPHAYVKAGEYLHCTNLQLSCVLLLNNRVMVVTTTFADEFKNCVDKESQDAITAIPYTTSSLKHASDTILSTLHVPNVAIPATVYLRAIPEVSVYGGTTRNDTKVIVRNLRLPVALSTLWYQMKLRVAEGTLARLLLLQLYQLEVSKMDKVDFVDWAMGASMQNTADCFEVCQYECANYRIDSYVEEVEKKYKVLLTLGDCERWQWGDVAMAGDSPITVISSPLLTRELRVYGADCNSICAAILHFVAKLNQIKRGQFFLPNGDYFALNQNTDLVEWIIPQTPVCTNDPLIKLRGFRVTWS